MARRRSEDADVLTPAELRVAEEAAGGSSNRETAQALERSEPHRRNPNPSNLPGSEPLLAR